LSACLDPADSTRIRRITPGGRLQIIALLALAALLMAGALRPDIVRGWARGELNVWLEPSYSPQLDVADDAIAPDTLAELHSRLLPTWILARFAQTARPSPERRDDEARAYFQLRHAAAPDGNMVALFDELRARLAERPVDSARVDYLVWALNDYQRARSRPYRVEGSLVDYAGHPQLYARSYRVAADMRAAAGDLRLLRRIDSTNLVEGDLGHTGRPEDGAIVLLDRVLAYSIHRVWPTLNAALEPRLDAPRRALASAVRAEAFDALSPDLLVLLHESAEDELSLLEVADSVAQRSRCGSTFRIWGLPWRGLAGADREQLVDALRLSRGSICPKVTPGEAARMLGASERLERTRDLTPAVEELATWVSRAVASHELRHVADDDVPACPGCPASMSPGTRAELSAYVSTMATPGIGYLALMQACHVGAGPESPHRRAVMYLERHLLEARCGESPPDDLYSRAARLERQLFGERTRVELPRDYPQRLTLLAPQAPSVASLRR